MLCSFEKTDIVGVARTSEVVYGTVEVEDDPRIRDFQALIPRDQIELE